MNNNIENPFEIFVLLVFLYMLGMIIGWGLEVLYRRIASKKRKWENPGFCVGPWLPVYGFGLVIIYIVTLIENVLPTENLVLNKIILFAFMSFCMTIVELIAGIIMLKAYNTRLWDYSKEWMNFYGLICPKFSVFWVILAAIYYFLIHPHITDSLHWLSMNLVFSFVVGFFFAIFLVDVIYSGNIIYKVRKVAREKGMIVHLEELKDDMRRKIAVRDAKISFFFYFTKERIINELLKR